MPSHQTTRFRRSLLFALVAVSFVAPQLAADGPSDPPRVFFQSSSDSPQAIFSTKPFAALFGPRATIGVQLVDVTPELREHFGADEDAGVLVSKVVADSPAQRAGLEVGDLIVAVDGQSMNSATEIGHAVRQHEEGDTVTIEVWRNGRLQTLSSGVEISEGPAGFPSGLENLSDAPFKDFLLRENDGDTVWEFHMAPEAWKNFNGSMDALRKSLDDPAVRGRFESLRRDREGLEEKIERLENRLLELEERLRKLDDR